MKRSAPLKRGKPLKRTRMVLSAKAQRSRRDRAEAWRLTCQVVATRCKGRCEPRVAKDCTGLHEETHHVLLRRFGDDSPENALAVCHRCHRWIHNNVAESYALGLLRKGNSNG